MKKPKILLSGKLKSQNYLDAVILSGGEGVFEYIPQDFEGYDGLILCGGSDVDPAYYGEEDNGSVNIDIKRDKAEFEILKLLMTNAGVVMSPKEIYRRVWNDAAYGAESTVAVHIRHIREKIEIDPKEPRYLKVVWGVGYKIEKQQVKEK